MVMPGLREPELRPDDVDDAARRRALAVERDAELAAVLLDLGELLARQLVGIGRDGSSVGIEWSAVATVWPGLRTFRPRSRRPVNACGLVTSWTRCRSTARIAGAPGSDDTTCVVPDLLYEGARSLSHGSTRNSMAPPHRLAQAAARTGVFEVTRTGQIGRALRDAAGGRPGRGG